MVNLTDSYDDFPIIFETLSTKGYQIWTDKYGAFWAEKDGWDFVSNNPAGLLGLIAIYEFKKPNKFEQRWWEK